MPRTDSEQELFMFCLHCGTKVALGLEGNNFVTNVIISYIYFEYGDNYSSEMQGYGNPNH